MLHPRPDPVDMQKGEENRYLREYLYQVPREPAHPGARW